MNLLSTEDCTEPDVLPLMFFCARINKISGKGETAMYKMAHSSFVLNAGTFLSGECFAGHIVLAA